MGIFSSLSFKLNDIMMFLVRNKVVGSDINEVYSSVPFDWNELRRGRILVIGSRGLPESFIIRHAEFLQK